MTQNYGWDMVELFWIKWLVSLFWYFALPASSSLYEGFTRTFSFDTPNGLLLLCHGNLRIFLCNKLLHLSLFACLKLDFFSPPTTRPLARGQRTDDNQTMGYNYSDDTQLFIKYLWPKMLIISSFFKIFRCNLKSWR